MQTAAPTAIASLVRFFMNNSLHLQFFVGFFPQMRPRHGVGFTLDFFVQEAYQ
jgi:hypothetical protein